MIDTHMHLDLLSEHFDDAQAAVAAAVAAGVTAIVSVGVDPRRSQALRGRAPAGLLIKTALGLHPQEVTSEPDIDDAFAVLERRLAEPDVVAVGECGLDARPGTGDATLHEAVLRRHLRLARARGLPVILHGVRKDAAMLSVLDDERGGAPVEGVWHGFSGSKDTMLHAVKRGLHISVGFVVLDERARRVREAVPHIPADRLLVETDAPPLPPARLVDVIAAVAALRGQSAQAIAALTAQNARRLFRF